MNIYNKFLYKYLVISFSYEFARRYFIYYDYKYTKIKMITGILCAPMLFFYNIFYDLLDNREYRITKIV
jgi:hypothetical protein